MKELVTIRIAVDVAQNLQHGLSDIACWARGYVSALPPDDRIHYEPMGIREVRDLNIILKGALSDHEEGKDAVDDTLVGLIRIATNACEATRDKQHGEVAYQLAAYLHDEIISVRRRLKGQAPLDDAQLWPFGEQP